MTRIPAPRAMGRIVMAVSTEMDLTEVESMEVVADMVGDMKGCDHLFRTRLVPLLLPAPAHKNHRRNTAHESIQ